MMNNLFNAIVIAVLVGTFVLTPAPQPAPPWPLPAADALAVLPAVDDTAAKAAIEAFGYTEVSGLAQAADGTWRAKAYLGKSEVRLIVDASGRVLLD
jgi:hypothetical protein